MMRGLSSSRHLAPLSRLRFPSTSPLPVSPPAVARIARSAPAVATWSLPPSMHSRQAPRHFRHVLRSPRWLSTRATRMRIEHARALSRGAVESEGG